MKKRFLLIFIVLIILFSLNVQAKECLEYLKPKINIEANYELFETVEFSQKILNYPQPYFNYIVINSSMRSFYMNYNTTQIKFTPKQYDVGKHKLMFITIDQLECYQSKLVTFKIYDKPKIIPLRPDTSYITIYEGLNQFIEVDIEDEDNDVKEFYWYVDGTRQKGNLEKKYVFTTDHESAGNYTVQLFVRDLKALNDTYEWRVLVKKSNRAPFLFSEIPDYAVPQGEQIKTDTLDNYFSDPDKEVLRYQIDIKDQEGKPLTTYITINENNELIIKAPENFTGIMVVEVITRDSSGELLRSIFTIRVFESQKEAGVQIKEFHVCGDKICGGEESCSTCNRDCGPCEPGMTKCESEWKCSDWSECILPGYNLRECVDANSCVDKSDKPRIARLCVKDKSCYDGLKNQAETKVDCGGPCDPCPTCFDFVQNQGELGIDCEGSCSASCPTCFDFVQNQFESDVDCGGPNCEDCGDLKKCFSYRDCKSHVCKDDICQIPTCNDSVTNQDEKGVDCEGVCGGVCPTCYDNLLNQDEEKIDCGGSCDPCPSCFDEIRNQKEVLADCGGSCRSCTWDDLRKFSFVFAVASLLVGTFLVMAALAVLLYWFGKMWLLNAEVDSLIFYDKFLRKRKYLKTYSDKIDDAKASIDKLSVQLHTLNLQNAKKEFVDIVLDLLSVFQLNISNDYKFILDTLKDKKIKYPTNRIMLHLIEITKDVRNHKFLTDMVLADRIELIQKIFDQFKRHS